jgi:hypothetical protein
MDIGWGNDHRSKYRLRDHVPGRQDKNKSIPVFRSALSHYTESEKEGKYFVPIAWLQIAMTTELNVLESLER